MGEAFRRHAAGEAVGADGRTPDSRAATAAQRCLSAAGGSGSFVATYRRARDGVGRLVSRTPGVRLLGERDFLPAALGATGRLLDLVSSHFRILASVVGGPYL